MKNTFYKLLALFIMFSTTYSSCTHTRQNSEEDFKKGEEITKLFYSYLKENKTEQIFKLFHPKMFEYTSKEEFIESRASLNIKLGVFKDYELYKYNLKVVENDKQKSKFVFQYITSYTKEKAKETITLIYENDTLKIAGYEINSKALLK